MEYDVAKEVLPKLVNDVRVMLRPNRQLRVHRAFLLHRLQPEPIFLLLRDVVLNLLLRPFAALCYCG
jgi:hypothetical protein